MTRIIFVTNENEEIIINNPPLGLSILEIAHQNNIDLEGACEGSLACATCHIILDVEFYNKLEKPLEEEEDMLDLAFGLTHTSRLGCQVIFTEELNNMRIYLPSATRNIRN
jgi:ferredoxin